MPTSKAERRSAECCLFPDLHRIWKNKVDWRGLRRANLTVTNACLTGILIPDGPNAHSTKVAPMQSRLIALKSAVPPFALEQSHVALRAASLFRERKDIARLLPVFENTGIARRYSCVPIEWYEGGHGWVDRNGLYLEHATALLETVTHKLLAEVAIERGDLANAEVELNGALDQLREYPALLVAWRTYATLGRLRSRLGDGQAAREAFAQALAIIRTIAGNVSDEALRTTFMNSASVRQVLEGCR